MTEAVHVLNVITKLSFGGAQETVLRYCRGLNEERWDVALVSGTDVSPEGSLLDECRVLGVRLICLPWLRRSVRPFADLRALIQLVNLFRQERPAIVHTHSSKAGVLGRLAAKFAGVPVVVHTVHGWSFHEGMPRMTRALAVNIERFAARWTTALVVVADRDAEIGRVERIGRPDQYALVRSGIEVKAYESSPAARKEARTRLGISEGVPTIGTVTRLSPQKDPGTLLTAVRCVVDKRPDVQCLIVGDGPLRPEIERLVEQLDLNRHVRLLGSRDDVPAVLPGFDVFVLSSRWEGLPRVVLEAMAAGVPVVTTNAGGVTEAVEHEKTGVVVPVGDGAALAGGLLRILGDPDLSERMTTAAKDRVGAFDTEIMIRDLEELYERLLS